MTQVTLSNSQKQLLTTLVNEYEETDAPVKAERIATMMGRDTGTIRNKMQGLKSINAVRGVPGPAGGYEPTETAFDILGRSDVEDPATVILSQEFDRVPVTVDRITFPNVLHGESGTAHIHFQQSVSQIEIGDSIAIGPTPKTKLVVGGEVKAVNEIGDKVLIDVLLVEAPVGETEDEASAGETEDEASEIGDE